MPSVGMLSRRSGGIIPVSIRPGNVSAARTPAAFSSTDNASVRPRTACLVAE